MHGGTVQLRASQQRLKVDGQAVLVQGDLMGATVSGCPNNNPAAGQTPCLSITAIIGGIATTLAVNGQPVLLETAKGLTNGTPPAPVLWEVKAAGHTKLAAE
jgi:hypothetical protein